MSRLHKIFVNITCGKQFSVLAPPITDTRTPHIRLMTPTPHTCRQAGATQALKHPHPITRSDRHTNQIPMKYHNLHTHTHTPPHIFTDDIHVYTWQKKYTQELPTMFTTKTLRLSHPMFSSPYRQNTACSRTGLILLMMGIMMPEKC